MPSKETSHMQEQEVEISWEFHKSRVTVCTWLSVSKPAISISNFTLSKQFVVDSCLMTQKQTVSFIEQHILWQSTVIEVGTMAWSILDSLALPQRLAVSRWVTVVKLYKCVCHCWTPWKSSAQIYFACIQWLATEMNWFLLQTLQSFPFFPQTHILAVS